MDADAIVLTGLRVYGFHGVLPQERRDGQWFVVDVRLELDLGPAAASDDVADTVHYGELAEALSAVVAGEPVDLIETLAQRLADVCLTDPRVEAAEVTVHKPQAPIPLPFTDVAVAVRRQRSGHLIVGGRTGPHNVGEDPPRFGRTVAVLSIGSNLGDREAHLGSALSAFADVLVASSPVYETPPWGGVEQGPYLNAVLLVAGYAAPADWLARAHAAETAAERVRAERWGPRTLDVDVVCVRSEDGVEIVSADPVLTLPHPRAAERAFVLAPWLDVEPDAVLGGTPVRDLLAPLDTADITRLDDAPASP